MEQQCSIRRRILAPKSRLQPNRVIPSPHQCRLFRILAFRDRLFRGQVPDSRTCPKSANRRERFAVLPQTGAQGSTPSEVRVRRQLIRLAERELNGTYISPANLSSDCRRSGVIKADAARTVSDLRA